MATTAAGNPYVESSDLVANYPGVSLTLANRLDVVGVNPFADATARDAAITSPVQGQMCSLNDDDKVYRYDGAAWATVGGVGAANFTNVATGTYTDTGIDYKYITFTGSGSLVVDQAGFADILVVSGGGPGGNKAYYGSGGGGAGGLTHSANHYLDVGTLTLTVGAGGAINTFTGTASRLGSIIPAPGGTGGAHYSVTAYYAYLSSMPGGSGGGGNSGNNASRLASDGIVGIGNNGGAGVNGTGASGGGGGGGAGGAGVAGSGTVGGTGGAGSSSSITGSAVTRAGGGGGVGGTIGVGGTGGGGDASKVGTAGSGTANTGGGGGGAGGNGSLGIAGAGGSGVVIVRVAV